MDKKYLINEHGERLEILDRGEPCVGRVDGSTEYRTRAGFILSDTGWSEVDVEEHCKPTPTIGEEMMAWHEGLEPRPDNSRLPAIVAMLMAIQYDKEGHYGSSWKGKGEYRGIMSNIDRKYDRLDKMTKDEISDTIPSLGVLEEQLRTGTATASDVGESKIDAVADLTCYGLLYMTWLRDTYPLVFKIWVDKNVPKHLADKLSFL
jgi:hypothetical protein